MLFPPQNAFLLDESVIETLTMFMTPVTSKDSPAKLQIVAVAVKIAWRLAEQVETGFQGPPAPRLL